MEVVKGQSSQTPREARSRASRTIGFAQGWELSVNPDTAVYADDPKTERRVAKNVGLTLYNDGNLVASTMEGIQSFEKVFPHKDEYIEFPGQFKCNMKRDAEGNPLELELINGYFESKWEGQSLA